MSFSHPSTWLLSRYLLHAWLWDYRGSRYGRQGSSRTAGELPHVSGFAWADPEGEGNKAFVRLPASAVIHVWTRPARQAVQHRGPSTPAESRPMHFSWRNRTRANRRSGLSCQAVPPISTRHPWKRPTAARRDCRSGRLKPGGGGSTSHAYLFA